MGISKIVKGIILKNFKLWGVKFETELPPEFIITEHAHQRLLGRLKCSEEKIKKVTIKAWFSKEKLPTTWSNKREYFDRERYKNSEYRILMGYLFIFDTSFIPKINAHQKRLITVYNI